MTLLRPRTAFPLAIALLAFLFLGLFLLYPVFSVLAVSFLDKAGHLTAANYVRILGRSFYQESLWNSLWIGGLATLATTALGVPLAFCLARLPVPGKSAILVLAALPLVLPSFVGAYALVLLFGRAGVVTQFLRDLGIPFGSIYGTPGLVWVYTLTLYPYVLLPTLAAFKAVDVSIEEAGLNLGASRWRVFWTVILPVVLPSVLSGALLVLMETLENFGVPFVLAEDKPILAVEAYKLFAGEVASNSASAGVLAVLLVACTSTALLLQRHYLRRRRFATGARAAPPELRTGFGLRLLATVFCWGSVLAALVPFFAVLVISFLEYRGPVLHGNFSLGNFADLLNRSSRPLVNTVTLATAAALGAAVLGVPIGYVLTRYRSGISDLLDVVAMMPFAIAGTVLGIGLVVAYNSGILILTGGPLIMVIAYVVRKLPFNVRASSAILHQLDPSLEEASINLGVSPARTFFQLTVPMMLGGIVGGMVLTWVTVASELSSTVILYSGPWATMTVVMFQALEGTGAGVAAAAAAVLILATVVPLLLVYRLLRRHELAVM
ncbi:MAG TPA: iron ABC transporter permease [Stellaceae bacterium]|nr:iron ABC transporter permease [Stellaceae bacterium]